MALAFAREGADVAISHLPQEQADADETVRLIEKAGRTALALPADLGIRVNVVAPGPVWTPLIPATMPPEKVESFG